MPAELRRKLTLYGLTMIAVGCCIGSGIFRTPGDIVAQVHRPDFVILLWALGGLAALTGALTFAELGCMYPEAGGLYVYLREAYGEGMGFLYGWFALFVSTSGVIAALSVVCAEHLQYLAGSSGSAIPLAILITVLLTAVNLFGVNIGQWIANLFTGAKLLGLALIVGVGFFAANPEVAVLNAQSGFASQAPVDMSAAMASAFVGVLWSYGGWYHVTFMAGEARNPQRNIPWAMLLGTLIVTLVYVMANLAYMRLLPLQQLAGSRTVAADAMRVLGAWGGSLMAVLIALSTFGTIGIYCMTAPRMYYAIAKDGIFFKKLAEVHPRWGTPVNAMLIQNGWAIFLLLFWKTFENLILYVTFMDFLGILLVGTTVFVLRRKKPDHPRPYRTFAYPFTPLVFIAITAWFIAFNAYTSREKALPGLVVALAGWVAYRYYFKPRNKR